MAPLVARGKYIALASDDTIFVIDTLSGVYHKISIPAIQQDLKASEAVKDVKKDCKEVENREIRSEDASHINMGTCIAFTPCGSYLAACTSNKNLTVWRLSNYELVKQWVTPRKVSSLTFTSRNRLVVADKAGDCYEYSFLKATAETEEKGKMILGHLSYILDVVVTQDEKFIITSERDEKIRVSRFPNAYNIHNFCLGHTEFVTSLVLLPSNLLLSGSGDATIRLWDYVKGQELHSEKIRSSNDEDMDKAVRSIVLHPALDGCQFAAVLLNKCREIHMYKITDWRRFESHRLILDCCPLSAAFTEDGILYVITDDKSSPIQSFKMDNDSKFIRFKSPVVQEMLDDEHRLRFLQDCSRSCDGDLKPLYKRWFDNVQAYQQKKNDRLASSQTSESSDVSSTKRIRVE